MSQLPKVFKKGAIRIEVKKGETYYWCSCGSSNNQPFCDGSHKDTSFKPLEYTATEDRTVGFCGCKYTKNSPICDGSHKFIEGNE